MSPPPSTRGRQPGVEATRVAVLGAMGLVGGLLLLLHMLGGQFTGLDVPRVDVATLCAIRNALEHGDSLWLSPWLGNGGVLFGQPEAQLLYPPRWFQFLFSPDEGASLGIILQLVLCAGSGAWLMRTFRIRPLPALCGGAALALGGTALNLMTHGFYLSAAACMPAAWASSRRLLLHGTRTGLWGLAISMTLLLLGGDPQAVLLTVMLVAVECARSHRRRARVVLVMGAGLAGCLMGLLPWWGALVQLSLSARTNALPLDEVLTWSLEPLNLAGMLLPGPLAENLPGFGAVWQALKGDAAAAMPWNATPYVGAFALVLAILGARRVPHVALLGVVGLLCALGRHTPVFELLLRLLPPLSLFRFPAKYLWFTHMCVVVAATMGLAGLLRRRMQHRALSWFLLGGAALLVVMAVVLPLQGSLLPQELRADVTSILWKSAALPWCLLGLVAVWLGTGRRWMVLPAVLWMVDVASAVPGAIQVGPALEHAQSLAGVLAPVAPGRPPVVCVDRNLAWLTQAGTQDARAAQLGFARTIMLPEMQACDGATSAVPYTAMATSMQNALLDLLVSHPAQAASRAGCDAVILDGVVPGWTQVWAATSDPNATGPVLRVFSRPQQQPLAHVLERPVFVLDAATLPTRIQDTSETSPLVDDPTSTNPLEMTAFTGSQARVSRVEWPDPAQVQLTLEGSGGAIAVLKTSFVLGWRASQAGRELRTVRVDGALLGVAVEDVASGPVMLTYRPPHLMLAATVALFGLCLLAALHMLMRRKRPS